MTLGVATTNLQAQSNGVLREVYSNVNGATVADLTSHPSFPNSPSAETIQPNFEAPSEVAENYGQRLRALLVPPTTGSYVFYIASDDNSALYLSTDENPGLKQQIAQVTGWTSSREYNKEAGQRSSAITLVAGNRYYIEALMKEAGGGDNLAVAWQKPGDTPVANGTAPIPGPNLIIYGLGPPVVTGQPTNVTVVEGGSARFSIQLNRGLGASYQWLRNGTNIPGATQSSYTLAPVRSTDSGSMFHCFVSNAYGTTNSSSARLTVLPDTTPPSLVSVSYLGDNQILSVLFSEPVEAASANNTAHYQLNNGATVSNASLSEDGQTVVLSTTPLAGDVTYVLTVNNIRDRATTPNTILPNSSRTFTVGYSALDVAFITGSNEPLGPSSRRTGLVISEIMYHPTNRPDARNLEFVELYNSNPWAEPLSGFRLSGDIDFVFPTNTSIGALSYLVVAAVPGDVRTVYGLSSSVLGPFTNALNNAGGTIRLRDRMDAVLLEAVFDDDYPYPAAADGAGHSLVLGRPSYGERNAKAWVASDVVGGSPGRAETAASNPFRTVLINEVLAHTDEPQLDFIELFNYGNAAVNIGNCYLSDEGETNKFRIAAGTTIPARGSIAFTETQLGFSLDAAGEGIFFRNTNNTKVIDALKYDAQENGISFGRTPDGAPTFNRLIQPTPGTANAKRLVNDVVINEIMYNPVSREDDDEFIELHNRGSNAVDLAKWRLRGGISFTFPDDAFIPGGGYLIVARNAATLLTSHSNLSQTITLGDYSGRLGNGGDRIRLDKPEQIAFTNEFGVWGTNNVHMVVDEVEYGTGGRWAGFADAGGSSLELIDPRADHSLAPNWADSDETVKSAWTTVEFTGVLDHGAMANADELHIFLLGVGECLVDNVEVIQGAGANLLSNPTFESGFGGWFPQGTQEDSFLETTGGFNSSRSLHLIARGRGDPGANRIRAPLTTSIPSGATATLRAKVKWLKGHPEILLRLHGNYLEATGNFITTRDLGTPGAANSRAGNAGPAIVNVTHSPILPGAATSARVIAAVNDPDGLASLILNYRVDPATNYTKVGMSYQGAGLFSALIPGQLAGARVAYYIEAQDNAAPRAKTRFPDDAPTRECLITFGEPATTGSLGAYRMTITQATADRWASREKNSNRALDATFVYGSHRVIYNVRTLYSGSPWHTPGYSGPLSGAPDFVMNAPKDDLILGATDFVLEHPPEGTGQAQQAAFWIGKEMRAPYLYRRYVHWHLNGVKRGTIYEDSQQPNSDVVEEFFPDDSDGDLHKIEDWFEFDPTGDVRLGNVDATLGNFVTTGGAKKIARYRWCWRPRAIRESANNFTNLFALVDAVNSSAPQPFVTSVNNLVDIDPWMRVLAMERVAGNWDSYGYSRGKNMYAYKPQNGKWVLFAWDIEFVLGSGSNGSEDPLFGGNEPYVNTMHAQPVFQRAYWRAFEDAVNGPMVASTFNAMVDARYAGLTANGVSVGAPDGLKSYVLARRTYIQSQLATVASPFSVSGPTVFSTNRNLIVLSGTAPIGAATLLINGVEQRPAWTTVSNWTIRVALVPGENVLTVQGQNNKGALIPTATTTIRASYNGALESAADKLAINEIMYNPFTPDASYIELHNTSTANAFDISRWRIEGIDCDIPEGTIIEPGAFLIFAKDASVFSATYGPAFTVAGEFRGSLDNGGEPLELIQPGQGNQPDVLIDHVTYDDDPPWPASPDGTGPSLQLIDPRQDNARVANWNAVAAPTTNPPQTLVVITNGWKYNQSQDLSGISWMAQGFDDSTWANGTALLNVENAALPAPKGTTLTIGRLTYYFRTRFVYNGNLGVSLRMRTVIDDGAVFYLNGQEIYRLGMPGGTVNYSTLANRGVGDAAFEGPFTIPAGALLQGANVLAVEVHQNGSGSSDIVFGMTLETDPTGGSSLYTPGTVNSVSAVLPAFPKLWLNELLPNNASGITDAFGDRDPWLELYYGGTNTLSLSNFFLSDNYTNLTKWRFPANAQLGAGEFRLVWVDGESAESSASELHTSFRITNDIGSVALVWSNNNQLTILDYLNYNVPSVNRSYGNYPDGNVSGRQNFSIVTPGATNNAAGAAVTVFINEWMADNTATLADPADGDYEDWFEIYNPNTNAVDLSGYYLSDNLNTPDLWRIPSGTIVPPRGYLLVWADGEPGQNRPGSDPHADFRLSAGGEAIGLFAQGGAVIDAVIFGQQTNDISHGRFADGRSALYYMQATPRARNRVNESNQPPVLNNIPDHVMSEGTLLSITPLVSDPNPNQTFEWELGQGAPGGAAINRTNGVFTWIPSEAQGPGNYAITISVTDSGDPPLSDSRTFSIQVNETNASPTLATIGNRVIDETTALLVTATATDPDNQPGDLRYSFDSGNPTGMTIHATNGTIAWTPSETQGPGNYFITVRVIDNGEPPQSDVQTFAVQVRELNTAPSLAAAPNFTNHHGVTFQHTAQGSDADMPAQTLTYSLEGGTPIGATIGSQSGLFTWTPTLAQSDSTNIVRIRVTDDATPPGSAVTQFTIVVHGELRFSRIERAEGQVALHWKTIRGKTYRVQYTDALSPINWNNLADPVTADSDSATRSDTLPADGQRFYRLLLE